MKKIIFFICLFFSSVLLTNAEPCLIVTGDGTKIGDEIQCGTEHFYVISNDGENIRMMAKYNLLVGSNYYKVSFDTPYKDERDIYLNEEVQNKILDGYYLYNSLYEYDADNDTYLYNGASLYKKVNDENNTKSIVFFEKTHNIKDALNNEQVKEYLEQGYLYNLIGTSDGKYIGVEFYKNNYENKIIVLKNPVDTFSDLFNNNEIKQALESNWLSSIIYTEDNKYLGAKFYKTETSDYKTIILDKSVSTYEEVLRNEKVIQSLENGYTQYNQSDWNFYNYFLKDNNSYIGIKLYKDKSYEHQTIIFNQNLSNIKALRTNEIIKDLLNKDYTIGKVIYDSNSKIMGANMYKKEGYSYKTIIFETQKLLNKEFYNIEEVKKILEEGYKISIKFDDRCVSYLNDYTYCTTYGATFIKNDNYEYYSLFFDDEDIVTGNNINTYLDNNQTFLEYYYEKGYEVDSFYTDVYHITGKSTTYYHGVLLVKYIGEEQTNTSETTTEENVELLELYQDEKAIGAHGDERGTPSPEEIAIISNESMDGKFIEDLSTYEKGFRDYTYYEDLKSKEAYYYLYSYQETLRNNGYDILSVDTITVSELNTIVFNVTGEYLPLSKWYNNQIEDYDPVTGEKFYILGSIKDKMPEGYEWLWGTTYWTRTADPDWDNIYFVDTLGDLCASEYCEGVVGAGIRPVVTIAAEDVVYKIHTKTDGNGIVTADYIEAKEGTIVKFTVEPKEGYVLGAVKVTDANGNTIIFTDYTFTMPNANVTIEAVFLPINANTSDSILIMLIIMVLIGFATITTIKKTKKLR